MNNKGFAITGIIYTLFLLFLTILLSVLSILNRYQTMMVNSTKDIETTYEGTLINEENIINNLTITKAKGKYIFDVELIDGTIINNCYSYLDKGINFNIDNITMSPSKCNNNIKNKKLTSIYFFEGEM